MRSKLAKLVGSKYVDTFDWSIYDKIRDRFGENQPLGGVVFRSALKLVNYHTSCSKCHYAFEIDSYGRGCIHDCVYCYAKDTLTKRGYWNRPIPFPVDLAEVRKVFYQVFETDKRSKWRSIMEKRIPLRIGSMSDSFMHMDRKYKVTLELLKILNFYDYPHVIFTRSDLVADDLYLDQLRRDLAAVQFSISGNNETLTKKLEPGAPSVARRMAALAKLNHHGIWTTVRVNPLFPEFPDGYYSDIGSINLRFGSKNNCPRLELITPDFFSQLKEVGVPSVLAGFVRLSIPSLNRMSRALNMDLKPFFKPDLYSQKGDKRYSDKEISVYYLKLKSEAAKNGIRFTSCYIGNGEKDYYQYQDLWDNKADCCDVKGNVDGFKTTSQIVPWSERFRHSPGKDVAQISMQQDLQMRTTFADVIEKYRSLQSPPTDIDV
jgi:DNA repair photolyase